MTGHATSLQTFPAVLSRAWRILTRALRIAAMVVTGILVLEAWRALDTLASIHPWLAWGAVLLIGVPLAAWAARAAWRYARIPRVTAPPDLPPVEAGWGAAEQERYRRFAIRWLRHQQGNPHLPRTERERIPEAIADLERPLAPEEAPDTIAAARSLEARGTRWTLEIAEPLDRQADREIRGAAVRVAAATAVSPSVLMDSLITLAQNLDLMSRIADLYYGRPGLLGTARVARDVLGTAVAAGALEAITDHVTGALSEVTGSFASRWLGPVGQGLVNGVLTVRMGNAAKRRCRTFSSPRPRWSIPTVSDVRGEWKRVVRWIRADLGPAFAGPFGRFAGAAENGEPEEEEEASDDGPRSRRGGFFGRWLRRRDEDPPTWVDPEPDDSAGDPATDGPRPPGNDDPGRNDDDR
jgi:hypothetical protein